MQIDWLKRKPHFFTVINYIEKRILKKKPKEPNVRHGFLSFALSSKSIQKSNRPKNMTCLCLIW